MVEGARLHEPTQALPLAAGERIARKEKLPLAIASESKIEIEIEIEIKPRNPTSANQGRLNGMLRYPWRQSWGIPKSLPRLRGIPTG